MEDLHPTVVAFKEFINNHPPLLREIRKSGSSWQEYYEKWILLGEDDPHWDQYKASQETKEEQKNTGQESELIGKFIKYTSNMDISKMQGQVDQLSKAIASIQEMMEQFKKSKPDNQSSKDPFNWMRD